MTVSGKVSAASFGKRSIRQTRASRRTRSSTPNAIAERAVSFSGDFPMCSGTGRSRTSSLSLRVFTASVIPARLASGFAGVPNCSL